MVVAVLVVLVGLVVFGCVCVVRAQRGGPAWVRGVAALTLGLGGVIRAGGSRRPDARSADGDAD